MTLDLSALEAKLAAATHDPSGWERGRAIAQAKVALLEAAPELLRRARLLDEAREVLGALMRDAAGLHAESTCTATRCVVDDNVAKASALLKRIEGGE